MNENMKIKIKIYATLRQYIPNAAEIMREEGWDVSDGATVEEVMASMKLPENLRILALVNGVHCQDKAKQLSDGDTLLLYPLMSGG
jgi:molybdopterin converting factor small subunit